MGVCYDLINHKTKQTFDMGKHAYDLCVAITRHWPMTAEEIEARVMADEYFGQPPNPDEYASWLAVRLFEFLGDALKTEVAWDCDAHDDWRESTLDYKCTGSRYPGDYDGAKYKAAAWVG